MILDKNVKVKWSRVNEEHYVKKGYKRNEHEEFVSVKVKDLRDKEKTRILVQCDYCETKKTMEFRAHCRYLAKTPIKKYCCTKCNRKKRDEVENYKHKHGLLTENDMGFYRIRENRMKRLNEYIQEKGNIDGIRDSTIYAVFNSHKDDILEAIKELGFNPDELRNHARKNQWENEEDLKHALETYVTVYKRFPKKEELIHEVGISTNVIYKKYNGVNDLKKLINYKGDEALIDAKGDFNRSTYELVVANYLFAQTISYKREQYPFDKKTYNYRSDFTFKNKDNEIVYIEVWGFSKKDKSKWGLFYNQKRQEKEKLYKQYNLKLISVEPEVFNQSYNKINQALYDLFKNELNIENKSFNSQYLFKNQALTEEKLVDMVMQYSTDNKTIPNVTFISQKNSFLYSKIKQTYGSFENFAKIHNKKLKNVPNGYWTQKKINETFLYMINQYGFILSKQETEKLKDEKFNGFFGVLQRKTSIKVERVKFYLYCCQNNITLSPKDLEWINRLKNQIGIQEEILRNCLKEMLNFFKEHGFKTNILVKKEDVFNMYHHLFQTCGEIPSVSKMKRENTIEHYCLLARKIETQKKTNHYKLAFYDHCIKNEIVIPKWEKKNIQRIIKNAHSKPNEVQQAKNILEKLNRNVM